MNSETKGIDPVYLKYINFIKEKGIVSGIGIIAKFWDIDTLRSDHIALINEMKTSGKFEFWNHGYFHLWGGTNGYEFKDKDYEYQYTYMKKAQDVVKEKLDITMRTFGAPGNGVDIVTTSVLYNIEDLKVWMYNDVVPAAPGVLPLPLRTSIEWKIDGRRTPDYKSFKVSYEAISYNEPYLLCQLHPHRYDAEAFAQLDSTIDFLLSKDVKFILPYDYYLLKTNGLIADAGPDTTIGCDPETITIGSSNTSDDATSYSWTTIDGHIFSGANEKIATVDKYGTYKFTVKRTGSLTITDAVIVADGCGTSIKNKEILPDNFALTVYPNPFNPTTTIHFTIPNSSTVKIEIYNSLGQKVTELLNTNQTAGNHSVTWNANGFSSGVYFAIFRAISVDNNGIYSDMKKLLLLK